MSGSPPGSEPPGSEPAGSERAEPRGWSRWWRELRQGTWRGLIVLGAFNGLANEELTALVLEPGLSGPAPGHPEQAVPWVPPSAEERDLWARLESVR